MNLPKNTGVIDLVPSEFYLYQNYPNPFSGKTAIKLCVAYKTRVKLEVFDSEGRTVETLLDEEKEAGTYKIEFSAKEPVEDSIRRADRSAKGACSLPEGVYVYRLQAGDPSTSPSRDLGTVSPELVEGSNGSGQVFVATKEMLLLKQKTSPRELSSS